MEITKKQLEKIEDFVSTKLDSLIWHHTQEVRKIAVKLARLEKADKAIVDVAVLFHDLGKIKGDKGHVHRSAEMARKFLEREGFEQNFIEEVVYCVIAHGLPWENKSNLVNTPEAKVVFDADMVQHVSKFGVIKESIKFKDIFTRNLPEGLTKVRDILLKEYNMIITENGRKMAESGYKFVRDFFKELL